jgi:hypothetical protein
MVVVLGGKGFAEQPHVALVRAIQGIALDKWANRQVLISAQLL